ncbi:MAG: hypothetical protein ACXVP3_09130, partial [Actinomycetota bacterium]
MDDYSALAYRIAGGVADVRGCLILSRDGLILGTYPDDETVVKPAWMKFASLGDPERSFVEFGDQVWVYVRRPAYSAFAVADAGVRPGLVIDQLEQILFAAEEARNRRETLRMPEPSVAPSGKPRTSLHPLGDRVDGDPASTHANDARPWSRGTPPDASHARTASIAHVPAAVELAAVSEELGQTGDVPGPADGSADAGAGRPDAEASGSGEADGDLPDDRENAGQEESGEGSATGDRDKAKRNGRKGGGRMDPNGNDDGSGDIDADAEVDPVLLAKEFSGLLQIESGADEASS